MATDSLVRDILFYGYVHLHGHYFIDKNIYNKRRLMS